MLVSWLMVPNMCLFLPDIKQKSWRIEANDISLSFTHWLMIRGWKIPSLPLAATKNDGCCSLPSDHKTVTSLLVHIGYQPKRMDKRYKRRKERRCRWMKWVLSQGTRVGWREWWWTEWKCRWGEGWGKGMLFPHIFSDQSLTRTASFLLPYPCKLFLLSFYINTSNQQLQYSCGAIWSLSR